MNAKLKENDYICGTCKYYVYGYDGNYWDGDENYCHITGEFHDEDDTCDGWTDPDDEPTEDEQRANAGCDEAHRIMVEGRERL